jgi:hypothetical protein
MKKLFFAFLVLALFCAWTLSPAEAQRKAGKVPGFTLDRCPLCGQNWDGHYPRFNIVPEKLPRPRNEKWIKILRQTLALENQAKIQYANDSIKFNVHWPYMTVVAQDGNHIKWLENLFKAYRIIGDVSTPDFRKSKNLDSAYRIAIRTEKNLIKKYDWLMKNAPDDKTFEILETILVQTRIQYELFYQAHTLHRMQQYGIFRKRKVPGL